jgi:hypothetical protein
VCIENVSVSGYKEPLKSKKSGFKSDRDVMTCINFAFFLRLRTLSQSELMIN